jgi:hypothetical protein
MSRSLRIASVVLLGVILVGSRQAAASTLIIGSASGPGLDSPFGFRDYSETTGPNDIVQQLYSGTSFGTNPIEITALTFFIDSTSWRGHMFYTNESLYLSTSPATVGAPGTTLAVNRGTDFTQVYSGTRTVGFEGFPGDYFLDDCTDCTNTQLTFAITPFLYDPTQGDLMMEVRQASAVSDTDHITFQAGSDPAVALVDNFGGLFGGEVETQPGYGLRTQFTFDPVTQTVPEPGSLVLLGVGVLTVGRRGRTKSPSSTR